MFLRSHILIAQSQSLSTSTRREVSLEPASFTLYSFAKWKVFKLYDLWVLSKVCNQLYLLSHSIWYTLFTGTTANLTVDAFLTLETSDQIQQNENIELNVNNNMKELNAHTGIFRIWWTYLGRRYNRRLFLNRVCIRYLWCSVFIQRDMVRHAVRMLAVR